MLEYIYVHIDTTSNAVLSKGITNVDFDHSIVHHPQNLLLLDPAAEEGEYEVHTGLRIIRGEEAVSRYFNLIRRRRSSEEIKWMDFTDLAMLKQLTPLEISELLYFGHMKTHLHSPFFYKLQNNFVFFEFMDDMTRIYYRYLDEFYRILGDKITHVLLEKLNDRKTFFRRGVAVEKLDIEVLKELKTILQEGVVFCFSQTELQDKQYRIPIHVVEDSIWKTKSQRYLNEPVIATLVYHTGKKTWLIEREEDFGFSLGQAKING
ncbi:hypothetical protein RU97_GL001437 [Enterococcus canis]|uniref:Uncharacterized protein n=1 Tax=Enterococcus canis TaxID=214095 RepID=A0A1L8RGB4_9ENTE|nr:hypothetical protein [Enterococcus canis]OJG18819.1 hypothetical protein RU97_GL001437 [Enterococcus canis]